MRCPECGEVGCEHTTPQKYALSLLCPACLGGGKQTDPRDGSDICDVCVGVGAVMVEYSAPLPPTEVRDEAS